MAQSTQHKLGDWTPSSSSWRTRTEQSSDKRRACLERQERNTQQHSGACRSSVAGLPTTTRTSSSSTSSSGRFSERRDDGPSGPESERQRRAVKLGGLQVRPGPRQAHEGDSTGLGFPLGGVECGRRPRSRTRPVPRPPPSSSITLINYHTKIQFSFSFVGSRGDSHEQEEETAVHAAHAGEWHANPAERAALVVLTRAIALGLCVD